MLIFFYLQPDFLEFLEANEQVICRMKEREREREGEKEYGAQIIEKQRGQKKMECTVALFQWLIPTHLSRRRAERV